ncbi:MAG: hypothetical protein MUQ14_08185, partial [Burkholderiaceae bacterium]|nr:hypothetical protein [Burkholderiaceae bacterium]
LRARWSWPHATNLARIWPSAGYNLSRSLAAELGMLWVELSHRTARSRSPLQFVDRLVNKWQLDAPLSGLREPLKPCGCKGQMEADVAHSCASRLDPTQYA